MSTALKTPAGGPAGGPAKLSRREPLTRRQMWLTAAVWIAIIAVFGLLIWLSTLGGMVNGVGYDYWPMP